MTKTLKKGFTLVELIVVIAIIAILATVSVVGYSAFIKNANQSKVNQELAQAENVLMAEAVEGVTVSLDVEGDDNNPEPTANPTLEMSLDGSQIKFTFKDATSEHVQDLVDELFEKVGLSTTLKGEFTLAQNKLTYTLVDVDVSATLDVVMTGISG